MVQGNGDLDPCPLEAVTMNQAQKMLIAAITSYQRSGGGIEKFRVDCNFEPSCSEYAKQAIARFGAVRGTRLSLARIRRCSDRDVVAKIPDPIPEK
ncbi:MAG: putative component of membrane protein insertase Oxa1/YidC/SpoIIIJ protein YidD [Pseudohongiellaceae bacterium]